LVGITDFPTTAQITFGIEGMSCGDDCGDDFGEACTHKYRAPFVFTGTIRNVNVDLSGELIEDDESTVARMLAQQ
jgi:arylsulfatase